MDKPVITLSSSRNEVSIHDDFYYFIPLRLKSHVDITFTNLGEEDDIPIAHMFQLILIPAHLGTLMIM